mmetsp:Transcript_25232/g.50310  ORF Transcript_25232/g.50310 Transcript_25232/m.50310 type:complete len:315 (-) Transcript_25232:14-958(-)
MLRLFILLLLLCGKLGAALEGDAIQGGDDTGETEKVESIVENDETNVPPIIPLTTASSFRKHALSTFHSVLVVYKMDAESVFDTVTAEVCHDLKASYGPEAFKCYGLDCSLPELKATCKGYMKEVNTIPAVFSFSGAANKNPYQPKEKAMGREMVTAYTGSPQDKRSMMRWAKRYGPSWVKPLASRADDDANESDSEEVLPSVYLTTKKETPTPMFKGLSFEFWKRANFYIITDPDNLSPTIHLGDVEYTGDLSSRADIADFLDKRTPQAPEGRYYYQDSVDEAMSLYGGAENLSTLPPPQTFYWLPPPPPPPL